MKPIVFISRELTADSEFSKQLQLAGFEVIGTSLIQFKAIPFSSLPQVDWVFFYSKNAVQFFFENLRNAKLKFQAKWAVFGKGTAKALENELQLADFIGSGDPQLNAGYFALAAKGQKVLFPRAAQSQLSIQKLLENKIEAIDLVVYENQPLTHFELPKCDWLVFTSPMNAEAYFSKYPVQEGQQILAIGKTTAAALQQLGIANVKTAEEPSELALAQAIRGATPF